MRIVEVDLRRGIIKLVPQDNEDLYYLNLLIQEGDVVYAWTTRMLRDETTGERGERVRVFLGVKVVAKEFQKFTGRLRIRGVVVHAPDWLPAKGKHHTISVEPGTQVTIEKSGAIATVLEQIIRYAEKGRGKALLVAMDESEAAIAEVTNIGPRLLNVVKSSGGTRKTKFLKEGSMGKVLDKYITEVANSLAREAKRSDYMKVIVATPPTLKPSLYDKLVEKLPPDLSSKAMYFPVSTGGEAGVYELFRREDFGKLLEKLNIEFRERYVEEVFTRIAKGDRRVAVGLEEVYKAAEYRAIEVLIITPDILTEAQRDERIRKILEAANPSTTKLVIVDEDTEAGEKLKALGKVAALLHFPLE